LKSNRRLAETQCVRDTPPIPGISQRIGKSLFARECVVVLRGLQLRAKHAVLIEQVSVEVEISFEN